MVRKNYCTSLGLRADYGINVVTGRINFSFKITTTNVSEEELVDSLGMLIKIGQPIKLTRRRGDSFFLVCALTFKMTKEQILGDFSSSFRRAL